MLTKAMRKYVESEAKAGYTKHHQYVYNTRLREDGRQALKDLSLLAQNLPEGEVAQIFGGAEMSGLVEALMSRARLTKLWQFQGGRPLSTKIQSSIAGRNPAERLENLKELLDKNLTSKEDYEKKKSEIMSQL